MSKPIPSDEKRKKKRISNRPSIDKEEEEEFLPTPSKKPKTFISEVGLDNLDIDTIANIQNDYQSSVGDTEDEGVNISSTALDQVIIGTEGNQPNVKKLINPLLSPRLAKIIFQSQKIHQQAPVSSPAMINILGPMDRVSTISENQSSLRVNDFEVRIKIKPRITPILKVHLPLQLQWNRWRRQN
jgi:hypothetical protein